MVGLVWNKPKTASIYLSFYSNLIYCFICWYDTLCASAKLWVLKAGAGQWAFKWAQYQQTMLVCWCCCNYWMMENFLPRQWQTRILEVFFFFVSSTNFEKYLQSFNLIVLPIHGCLEGGGTKWKVTLFHKFIYFSPKEVGMMESGLLTELYKILRNNNFLRLYGLSSNK